MQQELNLDGLKYVVKNNLGLRFRYKFNIDFEVSVAYLNELEGLFEVAFIDADENLVPHELLGGVVDRLNVVEVNKILNQVSWL